MAIILHTEWLESPRGLKFCTTSGDFSARLHSNSFEPLSKNQLAPGFQRCIPPRTTTPKSRTHLKTPGSRSAAHVGNSSSQCKSNFVPFARGALLRGALCGGLGAHQGAAASALDESTPHEYGCGWGLQSGPNPHNRGHPPMNKQGVKQKLGSTVSTFALRC